MLAPFLLSRHPTSCVTLSKLLGLSESKFLTYKMMPPVMGLGKHLKCANTHIDYAVAR